MQRRAAEAIKARGYALILTDGDPECACAPLADEFVHLDTFAIEANEAHIGALRARYTVKAVFTAGADCHETVAVLACALGVHGLDPEISRICRQKYRTREILAAAGIPQPRFATARTLEEARNALSRIGVPAALKATDNSGSRGFSRIDKAEDLNGESFARALANGTTGLAIVEELLLPVKAEIAEQSVETVWYDGRMRWLNWVDRLFRKDFNIVQHPWNAGDDPYRDTSWAVELAHVNPAQHADALRREVESLVRAAGRAIGMETQKGGHILKADIMLTIKRPMILELAPRLSGGWDSSFSTPERGADFVGGALGLALGENLDEAYWRKYFAYKHREHVVAVLAKVREDAADCIDRQFVSGGGETRATAIAAAYENLKSQRFFG